MHEVLRKTLGGLSGAYLARQLFFGSIPLILFIAMVATGKASFSFGQVLFFIVNGLLYPYSRFVYESVAGFLLGQNQFFVNAVWLLMVKVFTMSACWAFALLVAPIGFIYLFLHHTQAERNSRKVLSPSPTLL